ncbi:hypothetical protein Acr_00g0019800 [Actinidia rufa]|uniref:Uncharacterized protein n=1 Tax=Actinidia rufa TaxID=165716 RepID=A0A7J0DBT3_9ERIC|nr:hypothetical protein Acr_00g0019800 [Actinidia rufa]
MVSLDYTRSAKSMITVAMIAVRFILIGPQSMRMRAVKMKPMPMKFLVVGVIKEVVVRGVVAKGIMIKEVTKAVTTGSTTRQGGNPNPYAKASGDKGYRCGEPGYRSNTCPKRATVNLVELPEEEDGGDDEGDADPYSYDPNEFQNDKESEYLGRSLVIQKLLLTPKKVDSSQRHKIFRGRCTINKRVCDLIIDSGSGENIASKSLVTKLGLKTENHPDPYTISWIKKGVEVKNDRKIVLDLLKESSVLKVPKEEGKSSVLLVHNEDEFDKEARESKQIFAMVLTEEAPKIPPEVLVAVQPLIKEF